MSSGYTPEGPGDPWQDPYNVGPHSNPYEQPSTRQYGSGPHSAPPPHYGQGPDSNPYPSGAPYGSDPGYPPPQDYGQSYGQPGYGPDYGQPGYASTDYAQPGYGPDYGAQPGYGPVDYGQPGYGAGYGAPHQHYGPGNPHPDSPKTQAIVALVLSVVALPTCYVSIGGIIGTILSIIGLSKADQDPQGARKLLRGAWIALGVNAGLLVLGAGMLVFFGLGGYLD
ncbi:DUF4190 domain-containing protein [Sinosporangium siamense]|uniref:DUF4190 domain-containing protein n=1 Tax=Sinosporangium siamense TaxID=1367973 RepID=A0A919RJI6_9ACTN|nr:DUF4190 domain-containing protein [Sinosporangium siamense]GII94793.1 hypothetical protein Ssi02_50240 [Sinosporangium siamense]